MDNIPFTEINGLKVITRETLALICPEALACHQTDNVGALDEDALDYIWFMDARPVLLKPVCEETYDREEWSQTNEPELGEWIAEQWDEYAVPFGDGKILILCGSLDDEGGNFWCHTEKTWTNYSF